MNHLGAEDNSIDSRMVGQKAGSKFEKVCKEYLEHTFPHLHLIRPGEWVVSKGIGSDYLIKPDVVVIRRPVKDQIINAQEVLSMN